MKNRTPWNEGTKGVMPIPWNKGTKGLIIAWNKGTAIYKKCVDCGKLSYWIRKTDRCHKCWLRTWSINIKNHPRWKKDRSTLKKSDRIINDSARKEWTRAVKNRDGWKCMIANDTCSGRLEAHHILSWSKFPELRYQINNGITLCHFHHPRRREDEMKLSPYFQQLVASRG